MSQECRVSPPIGEATSSQLVRRELPAVPVRSFGPVETYNFGAPAERPQALQRLCQYVDGGPFSGPLLLRGAAADWPATQTWSVDWLAEHHGSYRGMVRISPTMDFKYCSEKLTRWLDRWTCGAYMAPSYTTLMSLAEFAQRSRTNYNLPLLKYPDQEFYYMQAFLSKALLKDVDFDSPPFNVLKGHVQGQFRSRLTPGRIWMSPPGAVSPLHYDIPASMLTQVSGRKRLLLFQPEDLPRLYPYPAWHVLYRRARVNPVEPDLKRYPKFEGIMAYEALLNPGDVLYFPPYWAHYTESIDMSISVTSRLRQVPMNKEQPPSAGELASDGK